MDSIHVYGGVSLQGNVKIQGSKNAVLPILAATILTKEMNVIHNCPRITDVYQMLHLLRGIGCYVSWEGNGVRIDAGNVNLSRMDAEAITGMRSSLFLMGALLGRVGEIVMEYPGGCCIGNRPIDLHIEALKKMGVHFQIGSEHIAASARDGLKGATIKLDKPSVGATENVILAAVMAEGNTVIEAAALEPEVVALCQYLKVCGARIEGAGTARISIEGGNRLYGTGYTVPSDRIVAGTYLFGCLGAGGNVMLEDAPVEQMEAVLSLAESLGAEYHIEKEGLYIQAPEKLVPIGELITAPYPGFPTDLQSIVLTVLTRAEGTCIVNETIFENRFRVVDALNKMGADILMLDDKKVQVRGETSLEGCQVMAEELRGGAALIVAGLMAEGETIIDGCNYIERGYENICKDLRELGARIHSV